MCDACSHLEMIKSWLQLSGFESVYKGHREGHGQMESNSSLDCQSFVKYFGLQTNNYVNVIYVWLELILLRYHDTLRNSVFLQSWHTRPGRVDLY